MKLKESLSMAALALLASGAAGADEEEDRARIDALKERVAALAAEADRLEAINQIHRIQRAYGFYVDKGFWDEAADLFAEDATMEIGVDGVYEGRERIRELIVRHAGGNPEHGLPGLPFGQINHHMQLQPVVTIAPDGLSARARWRDFAMLGQWEEYAAWADAIMENRYVNDEGVWKIESVRYYTNFVAPYEGGWASLEPVEGDWKSDVAEAFPPDAEPTQRYQPFPNVFVPPFHYPNPVTGEPWEGEQ